MHGLIKLSTRIFLAAVIIIFTTGASAEYYIDPPGSEPACYTCRHRVIRYRTHCFNPCRKRHIVRRHRCHRPPVIIKVIRYRPEPVCGDDCVSTGCTTCREYDREGAIYSPANCC